MHQRLFRHSLGMKMKTEWIQPWFGYRCKLLWFMVCSTTAVLACSSAEQELWNDPVSPPRYAVDNLAIELPQLSVESAGDFASPGIMAPYYLEPVPERQFVVANDRLEHKIHLFDKMGNHLAAAGGEGRGPGEFTGATRLHLGHDHSLYIVDMRLHRISRFKVQGEELIYDTSYPVNLEGGTWLHNVYVTQWGKFGVFRSIVDYSSGDEAYYLYKLDEAFNQVEQLLELPGNEKMSLSEWSHIDHSVGQKTLWDLDGEWFYHTSSHSTMINRYNLRTGESAADAWFELAEREITTENRNHLMEYTSNIIRRFPDLRKTMEAVAVLPLFQEFLVHDNVLYLVIFNVEGSERTEIIRINEVTEEVHYIDIPLKLWRIQAGNGMLYGIENPEDSDSVIHIVKLAE
ncbi:MAG: 6-bladed beta-propeller [Balneolaceae bacterium]